MNIFRKIRASLRLTEAVRKADNAHKKTGERYYVMPNGDNGNLIIMNRFNFRKLKQKGYISAAVKMSDLKRECFYCTPDRGGNCELPDSVVAMKRSSYYSWIELKKEKGGHG